MSRLIGILIVVALLYGGYRLFLYWQSYQDRQETAQKEAAAAVVEPGSLPGLPPSLEASLKAAEAQGPAVLKKWLQAYGPQVQDPRKAWIEMDYCEALFRQNPAEARQVFAAVKNRTPPSSPVWPRIQQVEKSFE